MANDSGGVPKRISMDEVRELFGADYVDARLREGGRARAERVAELRKLYEGHDQTA